MMVFVAVPLVHLLVDILNISSATIVRLAVGVVDNVVFCQVVENGMVLFLIDLLMTDLIHLCRGGKMFDSYPNFGKT